MLGLQYLYKSGYDPLAFVDFFEKIETMEKKKPGTLDKVFSTHPMTGDRIKAAQENIQSLATRSEYVLDTSEFRDVKSRLAMLQNKRKPDARPDGRPTLRKSPSDTLDPDADGKPAKTDTDERPTSERRN